MAQVVEIFPHGRQGFAAHADSIMAADDLVM